MGTYQQTTREVVNVTVTRHFTESVLIPSGDIT